jgi:MFS family permease
LQIGRDELGTPTPQNESAKGGSWLILPKLRLAALPRAGRADDIFGRRRKLVAGLVVFSASSLVGGLATSATMLVIARAVQDVGAAMAAPARWL